MYLGYQYLTRPALDIQNLNYSQFGQPTAQNSLEGLSYLVNSFISVPGIIPGGLSHAGIEVGFNGIGNLMSGNNFFEGWELPAIYGLVSGAYSGYRLSDAGGLNYWWGTDQSKWGYNRHQWSFFNSNVEDYEISFGIPNVGSNLDNDCMPTTFTEIETIRGGTRTYNNFKNITNYKENVGVSISGTNYDILVHNTFKNVQTLSRTYYSKLFDAQYMQIAANNNEVLSVHFKGHVDNVRSLKVFTRAPYLNKLTFRQRSFNFTSLGSNYPILNIFRFF